MDGRSQVTAIESAAPATAPPATVPPPAARPREDARGASLGRKRRRGLISPLTRRVLTVNVFALGTLVAGVLYLGQYEERLVRSELQALRTQAEVFAGALGQGAIGAGPDGSQQLLDDVARSMLRRLVEPTRGRARLYGSDGSLIVDSRSLVGPGGVVEMEYLTPPAEIGVIERSVFAAYDWVMRIVQTRREYELYVEKPVQHATDYEEIIEAFAGETVNQLRSDGAGGLVMGVAAPVQRFKQIHAVVLLTENSANIDAAVRQVRLDILKVFLLALTVTVALSLYLAGTIARPVRRLAAAAERVRRGRGRNRAIPDFAWRGDEIGDLSSALRDMTRALGERMEAIESFAADVAHEIKNPLTSLRSAVETAARVDNPEQQRRLMQIILDDVQRLDRLISDISDASRLDAELMRARMEKLDLGKLLQTLVGIRAESGANPSQPQLILAVQEGADFTLPGLEGRLVEVFDNLIANAFSFSPPGGTVSISAKREGEEVVVEVEDQGPGIPEENLETIFQRFYTERPAGERFGKHSGLGLSISRQICEAHGGILTASNRRDPSGRVIGARFTVRLPAE
jgi:two-component system sensor histidine kinase ChvG